MELVPTQYNFTVDSIINRINNNDSLITLFKPTEITGNQLLSLSSALINNTKLTSLDLSELKENDGDDLLISLKVGLLQNKGIIELNLSNHEYIDTYNIIVDIINRNKLITLIITNSYLNNFQYIADAIEKNKSIAFLTLSEVTNQNESDLSYIISDYANIFNNKNIIELDISYNNIYLYEKELDDYPYEYGFVPVVETSETDVERNLATNKTLKKLNMSGNSITSYNIDFLVKNLNKNKTLLDLDLSDNSFLKTFILTNNVKRLILRNIQLDTLKEEDLDLGILEELDLSYNSIDEFDKSSDVLFSKLENNTTLKILNLEGNSIEDGDQIIKMLEINSTLKELNLKDNQISEETLLKIENILESRQKMIKRAIS
jgi:hypothetical protein